jgi:nitrite reductase/ring-hydroxylating ferredoxin subunit
MNVTRRTFVTWASRGLAGLCAGGGALGAARFARPLQVEDLGARVSLGPLSALPPGTRIHLPEADVHLFHEAGGLYAISGKCTHLGCSLLLEPDGFACPCHGARFDLEGQPRSGPAPRPLVWLRLSVDLRGEAWLHLDQPVRPGTRAAS